MKNILVTGAGALLGQGILRMLRLCDFEKKIFTGDPDSRSTGHLLGDVALWLPKAKDDDYIKKIEQIVNVHEIDVILVGTDTELVKLAVYHDYFLTNYRCKIVISSSNVIKISNDKFLTAEFLRLNGFPYPKSAMATSYENVEKLVEEFGFPLFAKPVDGARSFGLLKINSKDDLRKIINPSSNLVVQQFLPDTLGEFTSGCIVVDGKCKAIITLKRDLRDGNTYRTYRDENTCQYDYILKEIAEVLNPDGPVNFQFRIVDNKPVIFEINGRFSGTTPLRSFYGFNEVQAVLDYYLFCKDIMVPKLRNGVVMRTWSDVFVENKFLKELTEDKIYYSPPADFFPFKI